MATAQFLQKQRPNGTVYVIGESGLTSAMHEAGYIITEHDPDYVVLGETNAFSLENLTKGIRLIIDGARFVATKPEEIERYSYIPTDVYDSVAEFEVG